jgi:hypothetical protein
MHLCLGSVPLDRVHARVADATLAITLGAGPGVVDHPELVGTAALLASVAIAQTTGVNKTLHDPMAGLTDAQREAVVATEHARDDNYMHEFIARHADPHSLPAAWIASYAAAPTDIKTAVADADVIVHAKVQSVAFQTNPSGGLPLAQSELEVLETLKGQSDSAISVLQLGGPRAAFGGRMAQLQMDPLVLPGDEVVVLLKRNAAGRSMRTVTGAGAFFVQGGAISGENAERYSLVGESLAQFISTLTTAVTQQ